MSPSAGSQSWYQALGVRAFPDSSIGSSFRLLTGWFQVRVLVRERERNGTFVRNLGPVHRSLVGELGVEDEREGPLGIVDRVRPLKAVTRFPRWQDRSSNRKSAPREGEDAGSSPVCPR